jgi:hypothetical protein
MDRKNTKGGDHMSEQLSRVEELKRKREHWKHHIESWQASGLPQREYCRHHHLSYYQFGYWKKRLVQSERGAKFVALNLGPSAGKRPSQSGCPLRLVVSNGFTIEIEPGFDPHLLRQLIIALRGLQ